MEKVIFKDELCDAVWNKSVGIGVLELNCHKGMLRVTGTATVQFKAYHSWCKGCDKKRIMDRKDLKDAFDSIVRNIEKELEG